MGLGLDPERDRLLQAAMAAQRAGRHDEAIAAFKRLIESNPDVSATPWVNLGIAYRATKKHRAALGCYRRALELQPDDPDVLSNLGNVLKDLERIDDALAVHRKAVGLNPADARLHHNYGVALREAGEMDAALAAFDITCRLAPDNAEAQWDRAIPLLHLGRFDEGWPAFEWRWRFGKIAKAFQDIPEWRGEDFAGKTLLVYPEQGFGDSILASRFLPLAKLRGGEVVLMCKKPLLRLFDGLPGVDRTVSPGDRVGTFDYQCPIMSLPAIFGTTRDNIPPPVKPAVPASSREKFRPLIEVAGSRFKVGIVWSGSVTYVANALRSTSIERFLKLAEIPGLQLFSLQKGPLERQLYDTGADALMIDLGTRVEDFADTAAVVEQLDLVVMTDSAVAHLCGALGRPVWNLLNFVPGWFYGMSGETTPWYPSMRLIRQSTRGDWDSVFKVVAEGLMAAIAAKRRAADAVVPGVAARLEQERRSGGFTGES
ncbi:MAG: tetratricopeptide repeat-containing glycosyltransferase family protein [Dongiaceae bacterium]